VERQQLMRRNSVPTPHRTFRSRRVALIAAVSLGVAACGSDTDSLPVIRIGDGPSAVGTSDSAAGDEARMSMLAWLEYELGEGVDLPALDGDAEAWVLRADVDAARIAELASVFGVEGEVVAQSAEMGGGWSVGATDGSTDQIWASADGAGWWSYSAAWDESRSGWSCGEPTVVSPDESSDASDPSEGSDSSKPTEPPTSDGGGSDGGAPDVLVDPLPECSEPEPPSGVPTADEAESLFTDLLADLDIDTSDLVVEPYADEWGAWVNASREIDGMPTQLSWSASYGGDAELLYASGAFAEPESIGNVPRVGTDAGFDRLSSDGGGWWNVSPLARATDTAVAPADIAQGGNPVDDGSPGVASDVEVDPMIDVMPVEPGEPITVTIVDVEASLWSVWDVDSTMWLLPAYDFIDADGGRYTVPAVPDEMIDSESASGTDDTMVTEPPDTSAVPTTMAPDNTEAPVDSSPEPEFPGGVESLVGLPEAEAVAAIEAAGFEARIIERDGESFAITMDYRVDRVNLEITEGIIDGASIG
jgi:hypothetical protein